MKRLRTSNQLRNESRRRGLTAVELLAATLLASMLMVAVMGVLKSVTQAQKALLRNGPAPAWQNRLVEQLQWDLANSQSIRTTIDGIELEGFAGRDFVTRAAVHNRAMIGYSVVQAGERSVLLRRETHLDSLNLDNTLAEIVCLGIEKLTVMPRAAETATAESNPAGGPQQTVRDGPIPDQLIVTLYDSNDSPPVFSHAFVVR